MIWDTPPPRLHTHTHTSALLTTVDFYISSLVQHTVKVPLERRAKGAKTIKNKTNWTYPKADEFRQLENGEGSNTHTPGNTIFWHIIWHFWHFQFGSQRSASGTRSKQTNTHTFHTQLNTAKTKSFDFRKSIMGSKTNSGRPRFSWKLVSCTSCQS